MATSRGRPPGSFKTAEEIAAMLPNERAKYYRNHKKYLRKSTGQKNRERRKRFLDSQDKNNWLKDVEAIKYDAYPETTLREWLKTHAPTRGILRVLTARWASSNHLVGQYLLGLRMLEQDTLRAIAFDTELSLENLLDDFDIIRFDKKKKEPDDGRNEQ
jgi:hypothetical protein